MGQTFDLLMKPFWATQFYHRLWKDHPAESPALIAYLHELKAKETAVITGGPAGINRRSSQGLFESHLDLKAPEPPGLPKLADFIYQSLQMVAAHVNGSRVDPRQLKVKIVNSRFHMSNDGGFHDAHHLPNCSWCGIYYLQLGEAGQRHGEGAPNGGSRFYSPLGGGQYRDYGNQYLDMLCVDPPIRDGMLLLFPSYLWHSALPYRGQLDRIAITFNAQITLS